MKQEDLTGATIDRFAYDTPSYPQEDFYALCDDDRPLVLIFLPNYGHPISRVFLTRYIESLDRLQSGRLACVVHSDPQVIAKNLSGEYPFPLICDADGVLYDYFNVQSTASRFCWSIDAARIFHDAAAQGFQLKKDAPQQLPLTLIVGRGGVILFSHYGESLTDMPENCEAMERICARLMKNLGKPAPAAEPPRREAFAQAASSAPAQSPAPAAEKLEEESMETRLAPEEEDAPLRRASPNDPDSWNQLLGLFAENKP